MEEIVETFSFIVATICELIACSFDRLPGELKGGGGGDFSLTKGY